MCGIAGRAEIAGTRRALRDSAVVPAAAASLIHRGPDDEGHFEDGRVALGHRRLSILDLSGAGRQPMSNETGDVWVTYNGEIYNYRELRKELAAAGHVFRSDSDTEVLVHGFEEWGIEGLLRRLRGMFAFGLYDAKAAGSRSGDGEYFFLARDPLGIKPLYYSELPDGGLVFASEVKALARCGAVSTEADPVAIAAFLCLGSIPWPRTWLKQVKCLPPGQLMRAGPRGVRIARYSRKEPSASAAPAEALGSLLEDTVRRHLVADVPVGIFLSGGVDSAGIAALARRSGHREVHTLTITFDEDEFNEAGPARRFAEHFRTEHRETLVTEADFARELPAILQAMDQPTNDGVNTYFVSKAAREAGLKVVLSGLGGDEVFLGYPHYRALADRRNLLRVFAGCPEILRTAGCGLASAWGALRGRENWQRFGYLPRRPPDEGLYLLMRGFFPPAQVARLLDADVKTVDDALEETFAGVRNGQPSSNARGADAFQHHEMTRYLHDQLLRDSDVFSMAHSIELRVPYLDSVLVDAVGRIDTGDKIAPALNKPLLVRAIDDPLVSEAARRRKRGFTFPFARWMRSQADSLEELALAKSLLARPAVKRTWQDFRQGRLHWSRAWSTAVLARPV